MRRHAGVELFYHNQDGLPDNVPSRDLAGRRQAGAGEPPQHLRGRGLLGVPPPSPLQRELGVDILCAADCPAPRDTGRDRGHGGWPRGRQLVRDDANVRRPRRENAPRSKRTGTMTTSTELRGRRTAIPRRPTLSPRPRAISKRSSNRLWFQIKFYVRTDCHSF